MTPPQVRSGIMGYGCYATPLGDAGYAVKDTCNHNGCDESIWRGLEQLCGNEPGAPSEPFGCGRWFCGKHLGYPLDMPVASLFGGGLCPGCTAARAANPYGWALAVGDTAWHYYIRADALALCGHPGAATLTARTPAVTWPADCEHCTTELGG